MNTLGRGVGWVFSVKAKSRVRLRGDDVVRKGKGNEVLKGVGRFSGFGGSVRGGEKSEKKVTGAGPPKVTGQDMPGLETKVTSHRGKDQQEEEGLEKKNDKVHKRSGGGKDRHLRGEKLKRTKEDKKIDSGWTVGLGATGGNSYKIQ